LDLGILGSGIMVLQTIIFSEMFLLLAFVRCCGRGGILTTLNIIRKIN